MYFDEDNLVLEIRLNSSLKKNVLINSIIEKLKQQES